MSHPIQLIENLYAELGSKAINDSGKAEILYNLVFIKKNEGIAEIYVDIKSFLKFYILSLEEKKYLYDKINYEKIKEIINLLNGDEKVTMYLYLKKLLFKYHFDEEWKKLKPEYYNSKIKLLHSIPYWYIKPNELIRNLYFKSLYSYWFLLVFLIIFITVDYTILLPNPSGLWPSLFTVEYQKISTNFLLNHFINIVYGLFEIDSKFEVTPINALGGILIILGKIFKIVFIIKYVADKILKEINLDE